MGVGNDPTWTNTTTFRPFPFPIPSAAQAARIRDLAEQLDAHRKRQQAAHPDLTLTGMYNVLAKLRSGEDLSTKEQRIHTEGLVAVLRQLHDDLDVAVAAAYGWPSDLPEAEILTRLVALNAQRATEEKSGKIRWLRPEFQAPTSTASPAAKVPWPKPLAERMALVRHQLNLAHDAGLTITGLRKQCTGAKAKDLEDLLTTLATLGHARQTDDRWYPT